SLHLRCTVFPYTTLFRSDENTGYAPYFREVLKEELRSILKDVKKPNGDSYDIYDDGLKIYTTINPIMQQYAEEAMAKQMMALQRSEEHTSELQSRENLVC